MTENKGKLDKIAIVGCGAVGSFYGAKLCQSGRDVHFLLRSDYEAVRDNGVHIQSLNRDFHVRPVTAKSPWEIGRCDLIVVGLKSTANHRLGELLTPLVGEGTVLLTLQNGLGNEAALAKRFPAQPVFGGMCFVCLNRIAPGVVQHLAHGKIVLGRHGGSPDELTGAIAELFRSTGIPVDVSPDLERRTGKSWSGISRSTVSVSPVRRDSTPHSSGGSAPANPSAPASPLTHCSTTGPGSNLSRN